jgi:hypothetical protein
VSTTGELKFRLNFEVGEIKSFNFAWYTVNIVASQPTCSDAKFTLDDSTPKSQSLSIFGQLDWQVTILSDFDDCGSLNIGLIQNDNDLYGSMSLATTKTNTTSSSVTYSFSGSQESFPIGTLSNIYVTVRNSFQTSFT